MVEVSRKGLWIRFHALTRADRRDLVLMGLLGGLAGFLGGLLRAVYEDSPRLSPGWCLLPIVPCIGFIFLVRRFCCRQDELYRQMDYFALRFAADCALGALLTYILAESVGRQPIPALWTILIVAFGGYWLGWVVAARRYL